MQTLHGDVPYIHTRYTPPSDPGVDFPLETMCQQHFAPDCDINQILRRYTQTGVLPQIAGSFYGDFGGLDYRESLHEINQAYDAFMALPATIRSDFGNDPANLLAALDDPSQQDRLIRLGLLEPQHSSPLDVTVLTDTVANDSQLIHKEN